MITRIKAKSLLCRVLLTGVFSFCNEAFAGLLTLLAFQKKSRYFFSDFPKFIFDRLGLQLSEKLGALTSKTAKLQT